MKIGKIMLKCLPNSAHLKSCDSMKTFETVRNGWRAEWFSACAFFRSLIAQIRLCKFKLAPVSSFNENFEKVFRGKTLKSHMASMTTGNLINQSESRIP